MHRVVVPAMAALLALLPVALAAPEAPFTSEYRLEDCSFSDRGRNPYFSLEPGDVLTFEGDDDGETLRLQISVLNDRRWVSFTTSDGAPLSVRTRVVEEREWVDDELVEVSRNFFARCQQTNDVFYFGEDVDIYDDGVIVSHSGAWLAGVDSALPGLIMPGTFLLGSRYFQEVAPGVALDRAEHVAMDLTIDVPAGPFDDCVEIRETTPLEPHSESRKVYCAGIGLVIDAEAQLVEREASEEDATTSNPLPWRRRR